MKEMEATTLGLTIENNQVSKIYYFEFKDENMC